MKNWKNTTDFLREIPLPEQTRTYKPVSHAIFIDEIKEELYKRGHSVKTERYLTANNGLIMTGNFTVDNPDSHINPAIFFTNSYNKMRKAELTTGAIVLICSNGLIRQEVAHRFSKKHSGTVLEDLRNNIGAGFLGFKISTILKQPLAKIIAGSLLGKHTFAYDVEFIKNKLWETVDNVSLQQRYRAFDDPSYDVSRLNKWQRWGYESIKQTDKITANNVWYAAYRKYFADNKIEFNIEDFKAGRINDEALRFADELTRKTQGSAEIKDISKMFRADDRVIWKILFQFQSFILNQSQLLTVDMKNAIIKEKDPNKAFSILMFFVLTGLGEGYITSGLTGIFGSERAKKEEEERTIGERLADAFFGQIPLINNYIGVTKFGGSGIPLIDTSLDVFTGLDSIFTSEEDKAKLKGATELLSGAASLFGVSGAKQLQQFINAGISSMDDEKTYPTTTRTETLDETDLFNEVKLFDDTKLF